MFRPTGASKSVNVFCPGCSRPLVTPSSYKTGKIIIKGNLSVLLVYQENQARPSTTLRKINLSYTITPRVSSDKGKDGNEIWLSPGPQLCITPRASLWNIDLHLQSSVTLAAPRSAGGGFMRLVWQDAQKPHVNTAVPRAFSPLTLLIIDRCSRHQERRRRKGQRVGHYLFCSGHKVNRGNRRRLLSGSRNIWRRRRRRRRRRSWWSATLDWA